MAYAGSRGIGLYGSLNYDLLPNQFLSLGDRLRDQLPNPFFGLITRGALSTPTVSRAQLLRPYPQYIGFTAGNTYDERAFCLARSRFSIADVELLKGWHGPEGSGWRWTERHFSVKSDSQASNRPSRLRLSFFLGEKQLALLGPVKLSASVNGFELPSQVYSATGQQVYDRTLPADLNCDEGVRTDFWLDKAQPPSEADKRELGIIVTSVHFESASERAIV